MDKGVAFRVHKHASFQVCLSLLGGSDTCYEDGLLPPSHFNRAFLQHLQYQLPDSFSITDALLYKSRISILLYKIHHTFACRAGATCLVGRVGGCAVAKASTNWGSVLIS